MESFENKVIVITGGTDGIGKALVEAFILAGAKVATCGRNHDKLYSLQTTHAANELLVYNADVSSETDCSNFIANVIDVYGTIDILINNAGISMRSLFAEVQMETLKRVMDINFWGSVYCTKYALPHILKNKGTIVGVSSVAGYRGLPGRSVYSASKFAMNGWLEALRTELLETGVNVMWVCPGFTRSNIRNAALNKDAQPQGESPLNEASLMSAEECAALIIKAIEKRKRSLVLTFTDKRTVFMNRLLPSLTDKLVRNYFYKKGTLIK